MIRLFGLGEKIETTAQDAVLVERVLGLAPNGRRRTIDGTGPWLTGPSEALFSAAEITAIPNLAAAVADAREAEFATAGSTPASRAASSKSRTSALRVSSGRLTHVRPAGNRVGW